MVKYIQGKDGKFAGSIGDGKHAIPTSAAPLPGTQTLEPLTLDEHETELLAGLYKNVISAKGAGELVNPVNSNLKGLPFTTGLILDKVRVAGVGFDDDSSYQMAVGATGTWNNHPFIIGPGGNGYGTTLAIYAPGTNVENKTARPIGISSFSYGGGLGDLAEVAPKSLLDSMFRLSLERMWHNYPKVAENFTYPGVTKPEPVRKKFLGIF